MNKLFPNSDPKLPFGFYPYVVAAIVCFLIIGGQPFIPKAGDAALLLIAGGSATIGIVLHVVAFQIASAAAVSPYHYTQLIWGVLFGYMIFGDIPGLWVWAGAAVIISSGLYLYIAEQKNSAEPRSVSG